MGGQCLRFSEITGSTKSLDIGMWGERLSINTPVVAVGVEAGAKYHSVTRIKKKKKGPNCILGPQATVKMICHLLT